MLAAVLSLLVPRSAHAARPFLTDDARVAGEGVVQLETWVRLDRPSLQHWAAFAFGPTRQLELTVGAVHGAAFDAAGGWSYTAAGPLLQGKLLLVEARANRWPGVAVAAGTFTPIGVGAFTVRGWDFFEYVAVTQSLGANDRVLVHLNIGIFGSTDPSHGFVTPTWGLGAQLRVYGPLNAVAEVFSGDPYTGASDGALQAGIRVIISEGVQIDATAGTGIFGTPSLLTWGTLGLRLVSGSLW